jgi:hypothetical protein
MGFYVRKSLRAGPFRFNLSNSGIGVSAGVPGFRVGMGPRGNYVHMGGGGIYYRATLGPSGSRAATPALSPEMIPASTGIGEMQAIESGDVLGMVDSSSEQLLKEIREKHQKIALAKVAGWGTAALAVLMVMNGVGESGVIGVVIAGLVLTLAAMYYDQIRKSVVLFYELDADAEERFERFHEGFESLRGARRIWHVSARADVIDQKRNAGANSVIERQPVQCGTSGPPFLKTNVAVPSIPVGAQVLYFFPDRVLVYDRGNVGAVGYSALRMDTWPTRFIEDQGVPGDARVVDRTWRFVNKQGGPDRRFKDNREIPVCLYEAVHFKSDTGLNELLHLSRLGASEAFAAALRRLA